ncbi:MAG: RNase P subunit [Thaumarchaeota archaeon]|nr:RNase P subunit [Nitrososphaerota archaeon]
MRRKRKPKAEAAEVSRRILALATSRAGKNLRQAEEQAELARKVMLRFNVRFGWDLRRFYCHGCKKLIVPGVNARVRIGSGKDKTLRLTCLRCGYVNRRVLG